MMCLSFECKNSNFNKNIDETKENKRLGVLSKKTFQFSKITKIPFQIVISYCYLSSDVSFFKPNERT